MSYEDTLSCFEQFFNTHWTLTPIYWTNIAFDPPRDSNGNARPYVALTVRENASDEITLGSDNPWFRAQGIVVVQIFTVERSGRTFSASYADIIKGLFRQVLAVNERSDISVISSDNSFNSLTTDFLTSSFISDLSFEASGLTAPENAGAFTVSSVTQRKLIVTSTDLVDEAAGALANFHAVKNFSYRNSGLIRPRAPLITSVGVVGGWFQTNVTIPYSRDTQL